MSAINVPFSIAAAATKVIPLDRWGEPSYSIQLSSTGTGTALVEGTLQRINQGETAVWSVLNGVVGTALAELSALADPDLVVISGGPYEAIRITAATATITGNLLQSGSD